MGWTNSSTLLGVDMTPTEEYIIKYLSKMEELKRVKRDIEDLQIQYRDVSPALINKALELVQKEQSLKNRKRLCRGCELVLSSSYYTASQLKRTNPRCKKCLKKKEMKDEI